MRFVVSVLCVTPSRPGATVMARIKDFLLTPELTEELLTHLETAPDQV